MYSYIDGSKYKDRNDGQNIIQQNHAYKWQKKIKKNECEIYQVFTKEAVQMFRYQWETKNYQRG